MYLEFYGLKRRPFDMTPDPTFFFPSQKHTEALSSLVYTITEKRGLVVITGEIGSGKTTVCRTLLRKLDPDAKVAMITNTNLTAKQLLEAISSQFGLPTDNRTKVSLLSALNRFLLEQNQSGNSVVLILDEAQNLSVKALEEMRLLSNIETDTQKLVQIMLLGQPELRQKLNMPELEQLRQRVSLRYHLRSLDRNETRRYIQHRLNIAGDQGAVKFTKGALDSLYRFSRGTPRLINVVCDQALLMGYLREKSKLDHPIIDEIVAEFSCPDLEQYHKPEKNNGRPKASAFSRILRRKRGASAPNTEQASALSPLRDMDEFAHDNHQPPPQDEEELLQKIMRLKLAGITPENGAFIATVDGVQVRTGDRILGTKVAQVTEDRIVFISGEKRYQLAVETQGDSEEQLPLSQALAAGVGT
jgi:general secretion pathway protein A